REEAAHGVRGGHPHVGATVPRTTERGTSRWNREAMRRLACAGPFATGTRAPPRIFGRVPARARKRVTGAVRPPAAGSEQRLDVHHRAGPTVELLVRHAVDGRAREEVELVAEH